MLSETKKILLDHIKTIFELEKCYITSEKGISGGCIGVEIIKKIIGHKEPTGDAFALAIPLGHIIGRLGCLLGGCCYGTICNFPWGVSYPKNSLAFMHHVHDGFIAYECTK